MAQDWYPDTQAALISWHDNFSTQAAINGTTLGLTAGVSESGTSRVAGMENNARVGDYSEVATVSTVP